VIYELPGRQVPVGGFIFDIKGNQMQKLYGIVLFILVVFITVMFFLKQSYAKSAIEEIGDYTQVIVPAYALGMAMKERDWQGAAQLGAGFLSTEIAVHGLKSVTSVERPDRSDKNSFPSGHTAAAFSGAAFIHKRYGLKQAALPYAMASFTGFSRIYAKRHHWYDVAAGGALGFIFAWTFATKENSLSVSADTDQIYINFKSSF
jgi:membrane-associated phospholipid phosphatase